MKNKKGKKNFIKFVMLGQSQPFISTISAFFYKLIEISSIYYN